MRTWRTVVNGLIIGLVAVVAMGGPAVAAGPTLTLAPTHGKAADTFTATLDLSSSGGPCQASGMATFSWDGKQLGTGTINASCKASVMVKPPTGAAPGRHSVKAAFKLPTGPASREVGYQIDPTPKPSNSLAASAAVVTLPSAEPPTAGPAPKTPGPCLPTATGQGGVLAAAELPVGFEVTSAGPATLLPTTMDFGGRPPVKVVVRLSESVLPLQQALAEGTVFTCLHLDLGPGPGYEFANYALQRASISAVILGGDQGTEAQQTVNVDIVYQSVSWIYQPLQGAAVSGDSAQSSPPGGGGDWPRGLLVVAGLGLVAAVGVSVRAIRQARAKSALGTG